MINIFQGSKCHLVAAEVVALDPSLSMRTMWGVKSFAILFINIIYIDILYLLYFFRRRALPWWRSRTSSPNPLLCPPWTSTPFFLVAPRAWLLMQPVAMPGKVTTAKSQKCSHQIFFSKNVHTKYFSPKMFTPNIFLSPRGHIHCAAHNRVFGDSGLWKR